MIQSRLKTIILFHAPVICADVIPVVGTLPKPQDLHYALCYTGGMYYFYLFLEIRRNRL